MFLILFLYAPEVLYHKIYGYERIFFKIINKKKFEFEYIIKEDSDDKLIKSANHSIIKFLFIII